jgi:hypothetical protein
LVGNCLINQYLCCKQGFKVPLKAFTLTIGKAHGKNPANFPVQGPVTRSFSKAQLVTEDY